MVAQLVKNPHAVQERPGFNSWIGKIPWRRDKLPTPVFLGFPGGSDSKESACNVGDLGLIPGLGKIPWRRAWQPTPVLLPGVSHGQRSLAGYSLWGLKESDMTEWLTPLLSLSGSQTIEKYCDVILLASITRTRFRWSSTSLR